MTMPAHPPNNDCPCRQSLLGVVATNLPGADLNSSAGPKGGGHDCRDAGGRAMQEQLPRMPAIKSCRAQPFAVSLRKLVRNAGNARTSHQPSRCVPEASDRNAASRRYAGPRDDGSERRIATERRPTERRPTVRRPTVRRPQYPSSFEKDSPVY